MQRPEHFCDPGRGLQARKGNDIFKCCKVGTAQTIDGRLAIRKGTIYSQQSSQIEEWMCQAAIGPVKDRNLVISVCDIAPMQVAVYQTGRDTEGVEFIAEGDQAWFECADSLDLAGSSS